MHHERRRQTIPIAPAPADADGDVGLYEIRKKIYPRAVSGWFENASWAMVFITQIVYYGLPWLTWNDRQAVLFDIAARRFYIFGAVFWPQDVIYLAVLLIIAALSLFLFTAIAGRLWCGFACPQTVYTEIFLWIERKIEGSHTTRMRVDREPMTAAKLGKKTLKHAIWIAIALWTGITFVGYFTPFRPLLAGLPGDLGGWEGFWVGFYALATYGNAGYLREQVCKYMCPYARFQSVMFDRDTLVITYDAARGEPRGARGRKVDRASAGLGDCIDCSICVQVCPTGIDIRKGLQYECIGCAACIDGCNQVMDKMNYPRGLIRYTTVNALAHGYDVATMWKRVFRARTLVYLALLASIVDGDGGVAVAARIAEGRRDPRPRRARAGSGARHHRERLSPADHEHGRDRRSGSRSPPKACRDSRSSASTSRWPLPARRRAWCRCDCRRPPTPASRARTGSSSSSPRSTTRSSRAARNPRSSFHADRKASHAARRRRLPPRAPLVPRALALAPDSRPGHRGGRGASAPRGSPWSTDDGVVADDYYKRGLVINRELERAGRGQTLRMGAVLAVAPDGALRMELSGAPDAAMPPEVRVRFANATRAGLDRTASLARMPDGAYAGRIAPLPPGRWHIAAETDAWRLPAQEASGAVREVRLGAARVPD